LKEHLKNEGKEVPNYEDCDLNETEEMIVIKFKWGIAKFREGILMDISLN